MAIDTIVKIIQIDKSLSTYAAQKIKEKVNSSNPKIVLQSLDVRHFVCIIYFFDKFRRSNIFL